jgi:glutaconate CoA-transferase, subunit B
MRQDTRKFVEKLDYLTTPGYLSGPGTREVAGLPRNTGPYKVITQLGVMGFDLESKRMALVSTHPGVSVKDVVDNTGFKLIIPEYVPMTDMPSLEELRLLREKLDPNKIVIG